MPFFSYSSPFCLVKRYPPYIYYYIPIGIYCQCFFYLFLYFF
nr:MAG TPA: hypothetical protein [Caudoviricetes sp.]